MPLELYAVVRQQDPVDLPLAGPALFAMPQTVRFHVRKGQNLNVEVLRVLKFDGQTLCRVYREKYFIIFLPFKAYRLNGY